MTDGLSALVKQWETNADTEDETMSENHPLRVRTDTLRACAKELREALAAIVAQPQPAVCPHCQLPSVLPEVCTPEIRDVQNAQIARDGELYESGYFAGLKIGREERAAIVAQPSEAEELRDTLHRFGFHRCDVPACNCKGWHGGHSAQRLTEIGDALTEADIDLNGKTILGGVKELIQRAALVAQPRNPERVRRLAEGFAQNWLLPNDPDAADAGMVRTLATTMTAFYAAARSADERDAAFVAPQPDTWQPIETAPKDGSWVLAPTTPPDVMRFVNVPSEHGTSYWITAHHMELRPSFWMPLPSPPTSGVAPLAPQPPKQEPLPRVGYCRGTATRRHQMTIEWQGAYTICTLCKHPLKYATAAELKTLFNVEPPGWWPAPLVAPQPTQDTK